MTLRFALACLVAISGMLLGTGVRAHELQDRAAIETEVYRALEAEDFPKLEAMSGLYRATEARTSSGLWKLTMFYSGIDAFFDMDRKEDGYWVAAERIAAAWVERYPQSPSARLAFAQLLLNRAWSYRGGGYADTVEPQNWPPFFKFVERARGYLEAQKPIASKDPYWYEMMAQLAYIQSWPDARFAALIAEGEEKEPAYYQLYFTAMNYYAPKWGGSAAKIEAFARESVERTRRTEGWGMYARIYWYASQTQFGDNLFSESRVNWDDMKKGMDDVLAQYPDGWNIGNFVKFACLAGDRAKTKELLDRMDETVSWIVWERHEDFERCQSMAAD